MRYPWVVATIGAPPAAGDLGHEADRPMASLFKRAKDFAQSPKGKQLTEERRRGQQAREPSQTQGAGQRFMKKR